MTSVTSIWAEGRTAFGIFCSIASPVAVESVAGSGVDFVVLDLQHGEATIADLVPLIQAAELGGAAPIVRTPANDAALIMRSLDLGAHGVVVPMVSCASEARAAADACHYPPAGVRSFGPLRRGMREVQTANERVLCMPMIETAAGMANVDAIAATPGVDVLFVGEVDLALSMGVSPSEARSHPAIEEALATIKSAADRNEVRMGTYALNAQQALAHAGAGYSFVAVGGDRTYLRNGIQRQIEDLRDR